MAVTTTEKSTGAGRVVKVNDNNNKGVHVNEGAMLVEVRLSEFDRALLAGMSFSLVLAVLAGALG